MARFGGRPERRPLPTLVTLPSVSFRRDSTRFHNYSSMIMRSSFLVYTHSDSGRSVGAHLPQSFRLRVLFQMTMPR